MFHLCLCGVSVVVVNGTGVKRGDVGCFFFGWEWGEQVVLTVACRAPAPYGVCLFIVGSWDAEHPATHPLVINTWPSLVPRCCTCTVTRAQCPSAESVLWAGTAATASSTSRRRCRTHGRSPSNCWLMPSRAARPSRSVPPHPSPVSLVLSCI